MGSIRTKINQFKLLSGFTVLALLGHYDTAMAQTGLAFSPNTVTLNAQQGSSNQAAADVTVTLNGVLLPSGTSPTYTATYTSGQPANYLQPFSNFTGTQSFIHIVANTAGLQPGTYTSTLTVNVNGTSGTIPITLNLYAGGTIAVDNPALTFNTQVNTTPAPQTVNVTTTPSGVPLTVATSTSWLQAAQSSTISPASLSISINPTGLAAGGYTGIVTVSSPSLLPVNINVTLNVTGLPVIGAAPTQVTLVYQSGVNSVYPSTTVQIGTSSGTVPYTGTVTNSNCGNFLQVTSGLSGTAPSALTLQTNLQNLAASQTCTATIVLSAPSAANSTLNIPVVVLLSPSPLLNSYPTAATFNYSVGGAIPAPISFNVSSSGNTPLNYSLSSTASFLSVPGTPPNGTPTPGTFSVSLNPAALSGLNAGTYTANVIVTALGSGNTLTLPITLNVSSNPLVTISQNFANFAYQTGSSIPAPVVVNVTATSGTLPFTLSFGTGSPQFISFSPVTGTASATPTAVSISLIPSVIAALAPGNYVNVINVSSGSGATAGNSQQITATLTVSSGALGAVSPQSLTFNYAQGGTVPALQAITVTSTGAPLMVTASSNQSWLLVGTNASAMTPTTVNVQIAPAGLAVGTYTGIVTVVAGTQVLQVPVTLNISSGIAISIAPTAFTFSQAANGAAPAAQSLVLTTTGSQTITYSATATTATGGNWLVLNGSATATITGTAPSTVTVTVNGATLAPGTYTGAINFSSINAVNPAFTVPVTLTVTAAQTLAASPATLTFSAAAGGTVPAAQTIAITSTSATPVPYTAAATVTGSVNWLSVSPTTGTTPGSLTVSVNQAGLVSGSYTGTVTVTGTAAGSTPLAIPVTLTVGAQPTPVVSAVINAASGSTGAVSPGEIITLFGTGLGPVTPASLTLVSASQVATTLAGVKITFNGIASPLVYVSAAQVNAVVPYEVSGQTSVTMVASFNGINSNPVTLSVVATAPGVFTVAGGSGQAALLNQNGSVNSSNNPAAKGSVIVIYATGEGVENPALVTGSVPAIATKAVATVTVTIGGQPAVVQYSGAAPGLIAGVLQVNATIPAGIASGNVPVVVTVGTASSQNNVTLAVQ